MRGGGLRALRGTLVVLAVVVCLRVLAGRATGGYAERRRRTLAVLSHHFLDVVTGLPALKVSGRAPAQRAVIGRVTDDYRPEISDISPYVRSPALAAPATGPARLVEMSGHIGIRPASLGHAPLSPVEEKGLAEEMVPVSDPFSSVRPKISGR